MNNKNASTSSLYNNLPMLPLKCSKKNKLSNWVFKLSPLFKILMIADPELAQFFMNLNPNYMKKGNI